MPATVTMPLEELESLKELIKGANAEIGDLKKQLLDEKMGGSSTEVKSLIELCRAAISVSQYAMANLSPEFSKKWPFEALRMIGERISILPDCSPFDVELGREMIKFAVECERFEKRRDVEGEKYVPEPPLQAPKPTATDTEMISENTMRG